MWNGPGAGTRDPWCERGKWYTAVRSLLVDCGLEHLDLDFSSDIKVSKPAIVAEKLQG